MFCTTTHGPVFLSILSCNSVTQFQYDFERDCVSWLFEAATVNCAYAARRTPLPDTIAARASLHLVWMVLFEAVESSVVPPRLTHDSSFVCQVLHVILRLCAQPLGIVFILQYLVNALHCKID